VNAFNNTPGVKMGSGVIICLSVFVCLGFLQYKAIVLQTATQRVREGWDRANNASLLQLSAHRPCPLCSPT
jgi:hypothetical protein